MLLKRLLFAVVVIVVPCASASAQQRERQIPYQPPAGPTISPYLDLYRGDTVTNPYYNFLLPGRRVNNALRQQSSALRRLEGQMLAPDGSAATGLQPTGISGGHRYYSHFFNVRRSPQHR